MREGAERVGEGRARAWRLAAGWVVVCLAALTWWAAHYAGWFARAGEWQFARFGSYYPVLTLALLLLALGVPALVGARVGTRRAPESPIARTQASVRRWRRLLGVLALAGAAMTLGVLASILTLPGSGNAPLRIVDPRAIPAPGEGLAELRSDLRIGPAARLDESYVVARRRLWVAPLSERLLTTMEPDGMEPDGDGPLRPAMRGVLVRAGVPAELRLLYARAGIAIAPDAALLMRDDAAVRWRSLVLAAQFALLTLAMAAGWAVLRRQGRRIEAAVARATSRFTD